MIPENTSPRSAAPVSTAADDAVDSYFDVVSVR